MARHDLMEPMHTKNAVLDVPRCIMAAGVMVAASASVVAALNAAAGSILVPAASPTPVGLDIAGLVRMIDSRSARLHVDGGAAYYAWLVVGRIRSSHLRCGGTGRARARRAEPRFSKQSKRPDWVWSGMSVLLR